MKKLIILVEIQNLIFSLILLHAIIMQTMSVIVIIIKIIALIKYYCQKCKIIILLLIFAQIFALHCEPIRAVIVHPNRQSSTQSSGRGKSRSDQVDLSTTAVLQQHHRTLPANHWESTNPNADYSQEQMNDERRLYNYLMRNYDTNIRPVIDSSQSVNIRLGVTLAQIFDLDEKNQVLTTNIWLDQEWIDEFLTWNASDFGGTQKIRVPCQSIWLPDIVLYNNADDYTRGYMCSRAVIEPNGNVFWPPPTKLRSTCEVDVTYFPFDDQTCKMKLGSWIYDGNQVDILNRTENVDLSNYVPNGEWDLIETRLVRNVAYYPCCPEPFPDVTITLIIRRKILYYLYNVILPCIMMSTLTLLVFCLPPESGEKIALGVTVLLAFSVFMLAISEKLPETSVSIPLLGIYLTVVMGITSISIVMTVVVLNLHYYSPLNKRELPPWLKRLVAKRHYASPAEMFTNFGLKSQTKFCNSNIVKVCDQQVPPRPPESGTILPTKTDTNVSAAAAAAAAAEAAAAVVNRNFDKLPNATPTFVSPASSASSFAHHHHHHHHHNHNQYPVSSSSAVSLFHISNNNRTNSTNFGGNTTTLDEKNQNNHSNSSSSSSKRTKYNWRKRVDRLTNSLFFAPTLGSFSFAFETINQNLEVTNVNQSDNREREQKQQQQTLQKSMLNCAQNATKSAITSAAAAAAASSATATNNPQASKHVKLSAFQAEFDGLCASIVPPSIGSGVGNHDPRGIGGNSKEMWNRSTMLNSITPYVLAGLSNARSSCGECSAPNTNYDNDDQDEDDHDQDEEEARRKSTLKLYQMRESNNESNFGGNFCAPSLNRRNFIIGKSSSNQPRHHRYHQHNYQQQQQQHQPQTSRFDSDDEYRETNQQQQQAQQQTQQQTQQQAQQQSERIGASASTCDHEIRQMLRYLMHRQEIEDDCTRRIHEWRQLSMFIDKILFWIFTTVTVFTSLLFLVIIPMHRRSY